MFWDIDPKQDLKIIDKYASTKLPVFCAFLETHLEGFQALLTTFTKNAKFHLPSEFI